MTLTILGCGHIAKNHAKRLSSRIHLKFWSRSSEKADAYAKMFGGRMAPQNLPNAITDPETSGFIVCTPPDTHLSLIEQILPTGKALLVEKPLCMSPDELHRIAELRKSFSKSVFMIAENYYYKPCVRFVRGILEAGSLGSIQRILIKKEFTQIDRGPAAEWKSKVGCLLEGGIHFIAQLNDLCESANLGAMTDLKAQFAESKGPDRSSVIDLNFAKASAQLRYSWEKPSMLKGLFQHSMIEGSLGRLVFESNGIYAFQNSRPRFFLQDIAGFDSMLLDFIQCIDTSREPYSNFQRAQRDLDVIFKAYQSSGRDFTGLPLKRLG
jgi:predicted dehydrogenase